MEILKSNCGFIFLYNIRVGFHWDFSITEASAVIFMLNVCYLKVLRIFNAQTVSPKQTLRHTIIVNKEF